MSYHTESIPSSRSKNNPNNDEILHDLKTHNQSCLSKKIDVLNFETELLYQMKIYLSNISI